MLYVSRAPWGIYDILEAFFQHHAIPVGPILFLREWGISLRSPLPRRAVDHKRHLIEAMMEPRNAFRTCTGRPPRGPRAIRQPDDRNGAGRPSPAPSASTT